MSEEKPIWEKVDPDEVCGVDYRKTNQPDETCGVNCQKFDQHHVASVAYAGGGDWFWFFETEDGYELGPLSTATSRYFPTAHDAMLACDQFIEGLLNNDENNA